MKRVFIRVMTALVFCAVSLSPAAAGAPAAGHSGEAASMTAFIGEVNGTAKVLLDGIEPWIDAKLAQKLTSGTRVRTGANSSLTVVFTDGTKAKLGSNAVFKVEEVTRSKVAVYLGMGRLDAWVAKLKGRLFLARNPVAVASVRGSVFSFDVKSPTQVEMFFFSGEFAVMDNFGRSQEVRVPAGELPQRMDASAVKGVSEPPKPAPGAPHPLEPNILSKAVLSAVQAAGMMPPPKFEPGKGPPPPPGTKGVPGDVPPPDQIPVDGESPQGMPPPPLPPLGGFFPPPPFPPPPPNMSKESYIAPPPYPPPPVSPYSP